MTEFEFLLEDRIAKIKQINELYDLENNSYLSFSGGKDSTVLHYLIDLALPNNKIPRVFIDTGIEYNLIKKYVKSFAEKDNRFFIIKPENNIKYILETYGYPFKSKEHSQKVALYQKSGETLTIKKYLGKDNKNSFLCPKVLKYQFSNKFTLKISDKCCTKLKKEPVNTWAINNNKTICLTGMRKGEGGLRTKLNCVVFDKEEHLKKFHPLAPLNNDFIEKFIKKYKIKLCELYYKPYNFTRTGCVCCPFSVNLQNQLNVLQMYLPSEYKKANIIWKKVYAEYKKNNYRLKKENKQLNIFEI